MYAECIATRRPSGPGSCPPELAGARDFAQGVPGWLVDAWSATVYARLQLGPIGLLLLLDPLNASIVAAEAVLYVTTRVLRGDCTIEGVVADEARATRTLLGYLRPLLPADAIPLVDAALAVLSGNASVSTLCHAAQSALPFLPPEAQAALPSSLSCPPLSSSDGLVFVRDPTFRGLPGLPTTTDGYDDEGSQLEGGSPWLVVAAVGTTVAVATGLALAFRSRRRRRRKAA